MPTTVPLALRAAAAALGGLLALTLAGPLAPAQAAPSASGVTTTTIDGSEAMGARSGVTLRIGKTAFRADGSSVALGVPLPADRLADFADLGDRFAVVGFTDGGFRVYILGERGTLLRSERAKGSRLIVNESRTAAGWLSPSSRVRIAQRGHAGLISMPATTRTTLDLTALDGRDCTVSCVAYVETPGQAWFVTTAGAQKRVPGFVVVTDSDERYRTGYTEQTLPDGYPCGAVVRRSDAATTWKGCNWIGTVISPDGRFSHQQPNHTDGWGARSIRFLGSSSGTVHSLFTSGVIQSAVWEDGSHMIATVMLPGEGEQMRWAVYRLGTDGSAERVTGFRAGPESGVSPFRLVAG